MLCSILGCSLFSTASSSLFDCNGTLDNRSNFPVLLSLLARGIFYLYLNGQKEDGIRRESDDKMVLITMHHRRRNNFSAKCGAVVGLTIPAHEIFAQTDSKVARASVVKCARDGQANVLKRGQR